MTREPDDRIPLAADGSPQNSPYLDGYLGEPTGLMRSSLDPSSTDPTSSNFYLKVNATSSKVSKLN